MQGVERELIERVLKGDMENPDQLLTIIANENIDLAQVMELWAGYLNDSWAPQIKTKIDEGFIAFRIQTEFHTIGHVTMIYMAKMKTS